MKINQEKCWMCRGKGKVSEPVCGWCQEGVPHSSCDDTYSYEISCPVCITKNEPKMTKIEYCPVCRDVVYCPEYTVHCNRDGVCQACYEQEELIQILIEEEKRYVISELSPY